MTNSKSRKVVERNSNLIVPIAFDDIFKVVFGSEENKDITAYLVSLLLKLPYEDVKDKIIFKSTRHNKNRTNEKNSEKDIVFVVDVSKPLKINIEMNRSVSIEQPLIDRNTYFLSNLFGSGLKIKDEYSNLKTTIQYNFNLDYVDKLNEPLIDEYLYRNLSGNILTSKSKIIHINLLKMFKLRYTNEYQKVKEISPVLFGLAALILETDKDKFEKLVNNVKMDKNIKEQLEMIVMDLNIDDELVTKYYDLEEERRKMDAACLEAKLKRLEKEMHEKLEKEIHEKLEKEIDWKLKKEMIINMHKDNCQLELISKYTKVEISKIKEILSEL